jgi:GT2 family glycosyltransferase
LKHYGAWYTALADAAFIFGVAIWRLRRLIQRRQDTDSPYVLIDSIRHSIFCTGIKVQMVESLAMPEAVARRSRVTQYAEPEDMRRRRELWASLPAKRSRATQQATHGIPATLKQSDVGIVLVGHNEEANLQRCLKGLVGLGLPIVYADSRSSDRSIEIARSLGVEVVEDASPLPWIATAYDRGVQRLIAIAPQTRFVQFIFGNSELDGGWIERALAEMAARPTAAVVCGRLRQRLPDCSIFNQFEDMWHAARSSGIDVHDLSVEGDVAPMVRLDALGAVGGIVLADHATRQPINYLKELGDRLRREGWTITRLDDTMVWCDSQILNHSTWETIARQRHRFCRATGTRPPRMLRTIWRMRHKVGIRSALALAVLAIVVRFDLVELLYLLVPRRASRPVHTSQDTKATESMLYNDIFRVP